MPTERRFLTGNYETDTSTAGLVLEDDGTVWVVNPDATRDQLGAGGGGASLLGPFAFDYQHANVNVDVFTLADLADGTFIWDVLLLTPTAWVSDTTPGATFKVEMVQIDPYASDYFLDSDAVIGRYAINEPFDVNLRKRTSIVDYAALAEDNFVPVTDVKLGVEVYVVAGANFIAGDAVVYLLATVPA